MARFSGTVRLLTGVMCILSLFLLSSCNRQEETLTIYAGKGLKRAVDEAITRYQKVQGKQVSVIYAGSQTLLDALQETRKGDIFIPGSKVYLEKAGDLVKRSVYLGEHVPTFVVRAESRTLVHFSDLSRPGVRIAVGNAKMAAIGRVSEKILAKTNAPDNFRSNIVITATTVNELLQLVNERKVDAALVWKDMLTWDGAAQLRQIPIPADVNQARQIWAAELTTSQAPGQAAAFLDLMAKEGKQIFSRHGFAN